MFLLDTDTIIYNMKGNEAIAEAAIRAGCEAYVTVQGVSETGLLAIW